MSTRRIKPKYPRKSSATKRGVSTAATRYDAASIATQLADPSMFRTPEALLHGAQMIDDFVRTGKLPPRPAGAEVIHLATRDGAEVVEFEPEFDAEGV